MPDLVFESCNVFDTDDLARANNILTQVAQFQSGAPPRVVIIGAGAAGLGAAQQLKQWGYDVVVLGTPPLSPFPAVSVINTFNLELLDNKRISPRFSLS